MARKEIISKDGLLDSAFNMIRESGFSELTARKLAAFAGCSTQPIFRNFENMEKIFFLDAYALIYRAYYAFIKDCFTFDKLSL